MVFCMPLFDLINRVKNLGYLILLLACGCHYVKDYSPLPASDENQSSLLADTILIGNAPLNCRLSVENFYATRNYSLFWSDGVRLAPAADSLLIVLRQVGRFGLIPSDYHLDEIQMLLADSISADRYSRLDLLLTDGFLALHSHIRDGRLYPETLLPRDLSATADEMAIASLQRIPDLSIIRELQSLEPKAAQYHLLKEALRSFTLLGEEDSIQHEQAEKIALNLERWRWQKQWPDRYVFVNIPAFVLRVFEKDSLWLKTRVIVGKRETPTPVLESVIRSFVIYPYWHVPRSIATKEILPSLKGNASYLRKNNFDVLNMGGTVVDPDTIQWTLYSPEQFPFILRQREGSENSMGIIKFNFANNYNVYLHDTNSKALFKRIERDLSHGCVRVDGAVSFAHYLVREDEIYVSPEDLDQYLSLQQRLKIDLRKPILLKLEYFTAEVENGATLFYGDIYKKDSMMMQSLYNRKMIAVTSGL